MKANKSERISTVAKRTISQEEFEKIKETVVERSGIVGVNTMNINTIVLDFLADLGIEVDYEW